MENEIPYTLLFHVASALGVIFFSLYGLKAFFCPTKPRFVAQRDQYGRRWVQDIETGILGMEKADAHLTPKRFEEPPPMDSKAGVITRSEGYRSHDD